MTIATSENKQQTAQPKSVANNNAGAGIAAPAVPVLQQKEVDEPEHEHLVQKKKAFQFASKNNNPESSAISQLKHNNTGMPDNLKSGVENLSGMDMGDVNVHYNSAKPAELNALAYAQGNDIHLGSGQEQHLPHEAWHVVQQRQGRVQATKQMKGGVAVNDDPGLEQEADVMGVKALQMFSHTPVLQTYSPTNHVAQLMPIQFEGKEETVDSEPKSDAVDAPQKQGEGWGSWMYKGVAGALSSGRDAVSSVAATTGNVLYNTSAAAAVAGLNTYDYVSSKGIRGMTADVVGAGKSVVGYVSEKGVSGIAGDVVGAGQSAVNYVAEKGISGMYEDATTAVHSAAEYISKAPEKADELTTGVGWDIVKGMLRKELQRLKDGGFHAILDPLLKAGDEFVIKQATNLAATAAATIVGAAFAAVIAPVLAVLAALKTALTIWDHLTDNIKTGLLYILGVITAKLPRTAYIQDLIVSGGKGDIRESVQGWIGHAEGWVASVKKYVAAPVSSAYAAIMGDKSSTPTDATATNGDVAVKKEGEMISINHPVLKFHVDNLKLGYENEKAPQKDDKAEAGDNQEKGKPGMIVNFFIQLRLFGKNIPERGEGDVKDELFVPFSGATKLKTKSSIILTNEMQLQDVVYVGKTAISNLNIDVSSGKMEAGELKVAELKILNDLLILKQSTASLASKKLGFSIQSAELKVVNFDITGTGVNLVVDDGEFKSLSFEKIEGKMENSLNFSTENIALNMETKTLSAKLASAKVDVLGTVLEGEIKDPIITNEGIDWKEASLTLPNLSFGSGTVSVDNLKGTLKGKKENYEYVLSAENFIGKLGETISFSGKKISFDGSKKELSAASAEATLKVFGKELTCDITDPVISKEGVSWTKATITTAEISIGEYLKATGLKADIGDKSKNYAYKISAENFIGDVPDLISVSGNELNYDSALNTFSASNAEGKLNVFGTEIKAAITAPKATEDGITWAEASISVDEISIGDYLKATGLKADIGDKTKNYEYELSAENFEGNLRNSLTVSGSKLVYSGKSKELSANSVNAKLDVFGQTINAKVEEPKITKEHVSGKIAKLEVNTSVFVITLENVEINSDKFGAEEASLKLTSKDGDEEKSGLTKGFDFGLFDYLNIGDIALTAKNVYYIKGHGFSIGSFSPKIPVIHIKLFGVDATVDPENKKIGIKSDIEIPGKIAGIWPFSLSAVVPVFPGASMNFGLGIGGGVILNFDATATRKAGKDMPYEFMSDAGIIGNLYINISGGIELGARVLLAVQANLYAQANLGIKASTILTGSVLYQDGNFTFLKPIEIPYSLKSKITAEVGAEINVKAFLFYNKQLKKVKFKEWNLGEWSKEGKIGSNSSGEKTEDKNEGKFGSAIIGPAVEEEIIEDENVVMTREQFIAASESTSWFGGERKNILPVDRALGVFDEVKKKDGVTSGELIAALENVQAEIVKYSNLFAVSGRMEAVRLLQKRVEAALGKLKK